LIAEVYPTKQRRQLLSHLMSKSKEMKNKEGLPSQSLSHPTSKAKSKMNKEAPLPSLLMHPPSKVKAQPSLPVKKTQVSMVKSPKKAMNSDEDASALPDTTLEQEIGAKI
jgi:hypothetical protein